MTRAARRVRELRAKQDEARTLNDMAQWRAALAWALLDAAEESAEEPLDEAMEHARWLLGQWRMSGTLLLAGVAHTARYRREGALGDLNVAITLLSEVDERAEAEGDDLRLSWFHHVTLAELRGVRLQAGPPVGGSLEDLRLSVAHCRRALELCGSAAERDRLRLLLGICLTRRAAQWPPMAEKDELEADALLEAAAAQDEPRLEAVYALGQVRLARGHRTGERALIESGIGLLERTLPELGEGTPQRADALSSLATAYAALDEDGVDGMVRHLRALSGITPEENVATRTGIATMLGPALFVQAVRDGADPALADEAIEVLGLAVGLQGAESRPAQVAQLGCLHFMRYTRTQHAADREAALTWLSRAVAAEELDGEFRAFSHSAVGLMRLEQAVAGTPDREGIDAAILHLEQGDESARAALGHARTLRKLFTGGFSSDAELAAGIAGVSADLERLAPDDPARPALTATLARLTAAQGGDRARTVELLEESLARMPGDAPERPQTLLALAGHLLGRAEGGLDGIDVDRVLALAEDAERHLDGPGSGDAPDVRVVRAFGHALRSLRDGDRGSFDAAVAELRALPRQEGWSGLAPAMVAVLLATRFGRSASLAEEAELQEALRRMGPGHPARKAAEMFVQRARVARGLLQGDTETVAAARESLSDMADGLPEGAPFKGLLEFTAAQEMVNQGVRRRDLRRLDAGVDRLRRFLAGSPPAVIAGGVRLFLALASVDRHRVSALPEDLDTGIGQLEALRDELGDQHPVMALLPLRLAEAYRLRDDDGLMDRRRALDTGLMALRERFGLVMTQQGTERGLAASKQTATFALMVADWALEDGQPALAVHALELGRSLVLGAGTATATAGALLRELGEDGLAAEWEESVRHADAPLPGLPTAHIPGDLRTRVLDALHGRGTARLLDPPPVSEIAAALAPSSLLVYLLPPAHRPHGTAVLVDGRSQVTALDLPSLDGPALDVLTRFAATPQEDPAWPTLLGEVCDLAHESVVGPLLAVSGGAATLVLIPWGVLGAIPWHAARAAVDGGHRYACQRAAFSVAASARQLLTVLARPALPPASAPVIVADPAGAALRWARWECDEIHRLHYPHARRYGRWRRDPLAARPAGGVAAATAEALLPVLPGGAAEEASLLHFGGHASSDGSSAASHLLVAGERLSVARILAQSRARPADRPGGVVVLSSCTSDLTRDDHDEALTLATAFLAAGATGVIGSRWMLDEDREIPEGLSAHLRDRAAELGLDDPVIWAAFTHQGR
ncbi:CHAT domain-containing protein [Nonomuraea sp. NPDC046570]|uniref:CHAT domain-containing protein n=1 Tax=Nonomuraea sp. NPDC046570 TaxID=3155255 RepID=UPI00340107D4